jgi:hypothetical protein
MIEGFRARGIYPENVVSLAEESLIWANAPDSLTPLDPHKIQWASEIALAATAFSLDPFQESLPEQNYGGFSLDEERELKSDLSAGLHDYAFNNAPQLLLDPSKEIEVHGFHSVFRVAQGGQLLTELVVQFAQKDEEKTTMLGGVPFRGGTTIVAGTDGRIRYVIAKPLPSSQLDPEAKGEADQRYNRQLETLQKMDLADPMLTYGTDEHFSKRSSLRAKIASLHQGVMG